MSDKPLKVYCLPVSGGALVAQLALLKELLSSEQNLSPDLVLASSGGNVSAYIAMAANWNPTAIDRISSQIESQMLVMNWWPKHLDFLPTALIGVFSGSIYRQGYGVSKLYENLFSCKSILDTEIWTGTYHKNNNREKFFCNKAEGTTLIKRESFEQDRILYNCEPLTYAEGNIDLLAKVSIASASIPVLVSEQNINGVEYADGGTMHASPLTVISSEIIKIINGNTTEEVKISKLTPEEDIVFEEKINIQDMFITKTDKRRLQLTYFSCYDIDGTINSNEGKNTVMADVGESFTSLIESLSVIDRAKSIELIKTIANISNTKLEYEHHPNLTTKELNNITKRIKTYSHYVLNLFPHGTPSINMLSFTSEDIARKMEEVSKAYGCHVWYIK